MKKFVIAFFVIFFLITPSLISRGPCWVPGDLYIKKFILVPESNLDCEKRVDEFIFKNKDVDLCKEILINYGPGGFTENDVQRKCIDETSPSR